jgi:ACS family hexuronate transporter-like MFS transporter
MERLTFADYGRSARWKWSICGLLFLATMLMYMDRLTLSQMAARITDELQLTNEHYGRMEMGFGLAFAAGAIIHGLLADRFSIRWLYPVMIIGWSLAGVATAWSADIGRTLLPFVGTHNEWLGMRGAPGDSPFLGMFVCRVALGFFEAGHWPCALITTQRLLSGADRTLGNSLLQSGASVGAVITPLIVFFLSDPEVVGSWRTSFIVIGFTGMSWIIPWLLMVRDRDLKHPPEAVTTTSAPQPTMWTRPFIKKVVVLLAIVVTINMTWQYLRAWMPKLMQEEHGYTETFTKFFTSGFYLFADIGCIAAGAMVKSLAGRMSLSLSRIVVFALCTQCCLLTAVAAGLPASWLLLSVFMVIGFGALGLFPVYYSLSQELSTRRLGILTGLLGATTWIITSYMQLLVGKNIDQTQSYASGLFWAGQMPLIGCVALALLWPEDEKPQPAAK